jgi:hypothetical protein
MTILQDCSEGPPYLTLNRLLDISSGQRPVKLDRKQSLTGGVLNMGVQLV